MLPSRPAGGPPLCFPPVRQEGRPFSPLPLAGGAGGGPLGATGLCQAATGAPAGPLPTSRKRGRGSSRRQSTDWKRGLPQAEEEAKAAASRKAASVAGGPPLCFPPVRQEGRPFSPLPLAGGAGGGPFGATGLCQAATGAPAGPLPASRKRGRGSSRRQSTGRKRGLPQAEEEAKAAASRKAASATGGFPLPPLPLAGGVGGGPPGATGFCRVSARAAAGPLPASPASGGGGSGRRQSTGRKRRFPPTNGGGGKGGRIVQSRFGSSRAAPFTPLPLAGGVGGGPLGATGLCGVSTGAPAGPHPASPASGGGGAGRRQSTDRKRCLPRRRGTRQRRPHRPRPASAVGGRPFSPLPLAGGVGGGPFGAMGLCRACTGAATGPHPASPASGGGYRATGNRTIGSAASRRQEGRRQRRPHRAKLLRRQEGRPFSPFRLREGSGEGLSARWVFAGFPPARQRAPTQPPPQAGEEERTAGNRPTGSAAFPASGGGGSSHWQSTGRKRCPLRSGGRRQGRPHRTKPLRRQEAPPFLPSRPAGGFPLLLPSRLREGLGEGLPAQRAFVGFPLARRQTSTRPPPQAGEEDWAAGNGAPAGSRGGPCALRLRAFNRPYTISSSTVPSASWV